MVTLQDTGSARTIIDSGRGIPSTPINLVATQVDSTSINLAWDRVGTGETSITIWRYNGSSYVPLIVLPSGSNIYTDTSCFHDTTYNYQITADNESGSSTPTSHVSATTAPSSTTIAESSATVVSGGTGYVVNDLITLVGGTFATAAIVKVLTISAGGVVTSVGNHNGSYSVVPSNPVSTTGGTGTGCTLSVGWWIPATGLTATVISPFSIDLTWNDNTGNNQTWFVEQSTNGSLYSVIALVTGQTFIGTISYLHTRAAYIPLSPNTTYYYRVRVSGGGGTSDYTPPVSATTTARTAGAPIEATNFVAIVNSATSTTLTWTDTNSGTANYLIETAPFNNVNTPSFTQVGSTSIGATSYALTTTKENFYYVRIRASNGTGDSGYTPNVIVRSASTGTGGTVYNIGPSQAYTSIGALNWSNLGPGDTVNIYPNTGNAPYYEKLIISTRGTAAAPINIVGISVGGIQPIMDGTNAIMNSQFSPAFESYENYAMILSTVLVGQTNSGWSPGYFNIQNLELRNGYSGDSNTNTYTNSFGDVVNWSLESFGIYIASGDHILIEGCNIHGNNGGVFAAGTGDVRNVEDITLSGNYIWGNGTVGSGQTHNSYMEGINIIYEYNTYGLLRTSAGGAGIKDRGAGTIIRYNSVTGGGHEIDINDADNYDLVTPSLPSYHTTFIYGNVIYTGITVLMLYYGGDVNPLPFQRNNACYFYNNTLVSQEDKSVDSDVILFTQSGGSIAPGPVDVRNNIIFVTSITTGQPAPLLYLLQNYGFGYFGVNWVTSGWHAYSGGSQTGYVAGTTDFINNVGNDPGFNSFSTGDLTLTNVSQCLNKADIIPSNCYPIISEYVVFGSTPSTISSAPNLGAFQ